MESLLSFLSRKKNKEKPEKEEDLSYFKNKKRKIRRSQKYGMLPPPRDEVLCLEEN